MMPNFALQAAPGLAFLFFLAQRPGAPELRCWISSHLMRLTAIILTAVLTVLAGCSRGPVNVSITNSSSITVSNVSLNSDRYSQIIGSLPPGASATLVYPRSDSRGWLYFEADGKKFESRGKTYRDYFEISSRRPLALVIGADLTVALASGTKSH